MATGTAFFDIPGVIWIPGMTLRARLWNLDTPGGSNVAELALTESVQGGGMSLYSGSSNAAVFDNTVRPHAREVRQVTAQTTVAFDAAVAVPVVARAEFAFASGGKWFPNLKPDTAGVTVTALNLSGTDNLWLRAIGVTNSTGDAMSLTSSGSNGRGLNVAGNGTGEGFLITGGSGGTGYHVVGGVGVDAVKIDAGAGGGYAYNIGGASAEAIHIIGGAGANPAVYLIGGSGAGQYGPGLKIAGGSAGTAGTDAIQLIAGKGAYAINGTAGITTTIGGASFSGANAVTLKFLDANSAAVPNVSFTVTGVGSGATDGTGQIVLSMNTGSYTVLGQATAGVIWASTTITVVSGTQTISITGSTASTPTPPTSSQAVVRVKCEYGDGSAWAGTVVEYRPTLKTSANALGFPGVWFKSVVTASDGMANCTVPVGEEVEFRLDGGTPVPYTATSSATVNLVGARYAVIGRLIGQIGLKKVLKVLPQLNTPRSDATPPNFCANVCAIWGKLFLCKLCKQNPSLVEGNRA